jgi:two-component system cell cycle response regulator
LTRCAKEHGEEVAEELQKRSASMLAKKVRKEDSLGHYSDSELAVVSPGTPYPACEAFANRLREAFAVANIAVHGQRLDLSVSIGVANTPVDRSASATSLLSLAGARLKTAQEAGGNRVLACLDKTSTEPPVPRLGACHRPDQNRPCPCGNPASRAVFAKRCYPFWNCWKGS